MSGDRYSIQDLGGAELARRYPDGGALPDATTYAGILQTDPEVRGVLSWLLSFKHCNSFRAVLSADAEGLRVLVPDDGFAAFIPWGDASVSAERGSPATVVHLKAAGLSSLTLVFNLDDDAADDLFRGVVPRLPRRHPPRRLAWWQDSPWLAVGLLAAAAGAALIVASFMRRN